MHNIWNILSCSPYSLRSKYPLFISFSFVFVHYLCLFTSFYFIYLFFLIILWMTENIKVFVFDLDKIMFSFFFHLFIQILYFVWHWNIIFVCNKKINKSFLLCRFPNIFSLVLLSFVHFLECSLFFLYLSLKHPNKKKRIYFLMIYIGFGVCYLWPISIKNYCCKSGLWLSKKTIHHLSSTIVVLSGVYSCIIYSSGTCSWIFPCLPIMNLWIYRRYIIILCNN